MQATPPAGITTEEFADLLRRFDLDAATARDLGRSQNFVYAALHRGTAASIARISAARHRTRLQIEAELNWIDVLAQRAVTVCPPLWSTRRQLCEEKSIHDTTYILSAFAQAPGRKPERADLTEGFAFRMGELIGRMHSAAVWATTAGVSFAREDWRSSRLLTHDLATTSAPIGEPFRNAVAELVAHIARLPATPTTFGLIHGDVNSGNCHLEADRVWIFDFDNCEYGYFLQDLAVILYDTFYSKFVKHLPPEELAAKVLSLWRPLLAGYRLTGPALALRAEDLGRLFLLREAVIYVHYYRVFPAAQMAGDDFVAGMKAHVESLAHPLNFDVLAEG